MTNYQKWLSSKTKEAFKEECSELRSWGDCHCCPAKKDCNDNNLCRDTNMFMKWANNEVI